MYSISPPACPVNDPLACLGAILKVHQLLLAIAQADALLLAHRELGSATPSEASTPINKHPPPHSGLSSPEKPSFAAEHGPGHAHAAPHSTPDAGDHHEGPTHGAMGTRQDAQHAQHAQHAPEQQQHEHKQAPKHKEGNDSHAADHGLPKPESLKHHDDGRADADSTTAYSRAATTACQSTKSQVSSGDFWQGCPCRCAGPACPLG